MATRTGDERSGTTQRILLSALDRFARDGIAATSMEQIAQDAELTRPALYYHFPSKRELILQVLALRVQQSHAQIAEEIRYQAATPELIIDANARAIELAWADRIASELAAPGNEQITAELLSRDSVVSEHRAFWIPILQAAADAGTIRADLDFNDLVNWMVFLQFSTVALGANFGLDSRDSVTVTLSRYLGPALNP